MPLGSHGTWPMQLCSHLTSTGHLAGLLSLGSVATGGVGGTAFGPQGGSHRSHCRHPMFPGGCSSGLQEFESQSFLYKQVESPVGSPSWGWGLRQAAAAVFALGHRCGE